MSIFASFRSTITPFWSRKWPSNLKLLVDPVTGAPVGIENPNANGADGIWVPLDVTTDQIANPSAAMIADQNAVYRINVTPYTRFQSDGATLISLNGNSVQGPNGIEGVMIVYSPFTVTEPGGVSIRGTISVRAMPA